MSGLLLCGVDEAGRGPLAGAVFAAAVILDPAHPIAGLADSKKLSEARRDALAIEIRQHALAWSIATARDIANKLACRILIWSISATLAVAGLSVRPDKVEVDGNRVPTLTIAVPVEAIVKGDAKVAAISAASILAKTARDAELVALDAEWPCYGFAQHKGYPTAAHLAALAQFGASPVHRQSFGPVKRLLAQGRLFG